MSEVPTPDAALTAASKCSTLGQTPYKPSTKPAHSLTVGLNLVLPTVQLRTLS